MTCTGWAPRLRGREGGRAWPECALARLQTESSQVECARAISFLENSLVLRRWPICRFLHFEPRDRFAKKIWHNRYEPREDEAACTRARARGFARLTDSVVVSSRLVSSLLPPLLCCTVFRTPKLPFTTVAVGRYLELAVATAERSNPIPREKE